MVSALRKGPVQYIHRAHQDLRARAAQLDAEAARHKVGGRAGGPGGGGG